MLLLSAAALAQGKQAKPDTAEQAVDRVVAAFKAKDGEALGALAKRNVPDPWHVVDLLCLRGKREEAEAFAKAASRPDTEKLPAYVTAWKPAADDDGARKARDEALAANRAKAYQEALDVTEGVGGTEIVAIGIAFQRAFALRMMVRHEASADAFRIAADRAEAIGWLAAANTALREGGMRAWERGDFDGATTLWKRRLAVAKRRGDRFEIGASIGNIAMVQVRRGNLVAGRDGYVASVKIMEELGSRHGVLVGLHNLGHVLRNLGDYDAALEHLERAREGWRALGREHSVAHAGLSIGALHSARMDFAPALEELRRSLAVMERLGDKRMQAHALSALSAVYRSMGEHGKALKTGERALVLSKAAGDRVAVASHPLQAGDPAPTNG